MSSFASGYVKYINHLEQINEAALTRPYEMILEVEGAYREHITNIARNILENHRRIKIVLLAGPSASGKTTTAKFLAEALTRLGAGAHIISLDDFYRGVGMAPLLPNGQYDYEAVEALDVQRVKDVLKSILEGRVFSLPKFSFDLGRPEEQETLDLVGEGEIAIVEGLHGLNPVFSSGLERFLRLYVSVKQGIEDVNGQVISPMDLRLIRRIVRDVKFRNTPAERSISMWGEVTSGEDRLIRPYRLLADYTVNSIHIYEPCVLRSHAIPLLRAIEPDSPCYRKARDLEAKLMRFEPVSPELVPGDSMLREFLGQT